MNKRTAGFQCITQIMQRCSGQGVVSCVDNMGIALGPFLVRAARLDHLHCVKFLVEVSHANLEEEGVVAGSRVYEKGATALWAAVVGGHFDVANYLVTKGANVNAATRSKTTPLFVACSQTRLDLVRLLVENGADLDQTNALGGTCLMRACNRGNPELVRYLIEIGAGVDRQRIDGITALHECAENGHLEAVKLLLDHYAYITPDIFGETPLLCASLKGHSHVVEYMTSRRDLVSPEDRIKALELLGATFADKRGDVAIAVMYWERAMNERRDNDIPVNTEAVDPRFSQYFQEVTTPQQLEEISYSQGAIAIQSMLVRVRVLGYTHHAAYADIRRKGDKFSTTGDVELCVVLWMRTLEAHQEALESLDLRRLLFLTALTDLFTSMVLRDREFHDNMYFEDILRLFGNCCKEVEVTMAHKITPASQYAYFHYLDRVIPLTMHLILVLFKFETSISSAQLLAVKRLVYKLVKLDPRDSTGRTLLHLACAVGFIFRTGTPMVSTFPSPEVVNVMLETGADPCATDHDRNTPLHALGMNEVCPREMVAALLSAGGHLDAVNKDGHSFGNLRAFHGEKLHQVVDPVRHTSLQCLAAAAVRKHGIKYKDVVHPRLERFVDMH